MVVPAGAIRPWATTGKQGTFVMTVDATRANDPNLVIEPPKNLAELPG